MSVSPFYPDTHYQYAWNSSAMGELKRCARAYYYKYIEGWTPVGSGMHIRFGLLYHAALELYDRRLVAGDSPDDAIDAAVDYLLCSTWDNRADDGSGGSPWDTQDTKKNRETLVRSVIWYVDHFASDPAQTYILADGSPALELEFKVELPWRTLTGEHYLYTGHLDRLVTYAGELLVSDRKTTGMTIGSYYFEQFSPDNQMSGYIYAGKLAYQQPVQGVLIDAAQIAVGFTAFGRSITTRSEGQMQEWLRDMECYTDMANRYVDQGFFPMNDKACFMCDFRKVCNKDPSVRDNWLKTNFERSTHNRDRVMGG